MVVVVVVALVARISQRDHEQLLIAIYTEIFKTNFYLTYFFLEFQILLCTFLKHSFVARIFASQFEVFFKNYYTFSEVVFYIWKKGSLSVIKIKIKFLISRLWIKLWLLYPKLFMWRSIKYRDSKILVIVTCFAQLV